MPTGKAVRATPRLLPPLAINFYIPPVPAAPFFTSCGTEARLQSKRQLLTLPPDALPSHPSGKAVHAAARLLHLSASYSRWTRGQPRMMAVALGANAALEVGC